MRIDNRLWWSVVTACAAWLTLGAVAVGGASAQNAPAAAAAGVPASAPAEPTAIRIWNSDIHDVDDKDLGGTPTISIASPRGGVFSAKVVAGGSGTIMGLKATASDLKGAGGAIPTGQVRVRYAVEWDQAMRGRWGRPKGEDVLLDQPPEEVPSGRMPIWVTVRVPKEAKAGAHSGTLTVEAKGNKPVAVPVKLEVLDWTVPAPQDYRTWTELVQSPDTLAVEYGVPLWSQKHWELTAQSLRLISGSGSRTIYLPLICQTNQGNEQTMVRWIKRGENQYDYDFSVLEKYLDLAAKELGKPKRVVLYAWDVLLTTPAARFTEPEANDSTWLKGEKERMRARAEQAKKGIPVTGWDPVTGKTDTIHLPLYTDPGSKALWGPVYKGIQERLANRGLEKAAILGMLSDWRPTKPEAAILDDLSGHMPWGSCSHHLRGAVERGTLGKLDGGGDVAMAMIALDYQFVYNPENGRMYGWKKPHVQLHCWQARQYFNAGTLSTARQEMECNITGGQRGIGHIGADFWPCVRNKAGARVGTVTDRWPQSYWHSMNIVDTMLAPGPAGPAATVRLQLFEEGQQECQARIAIESVLTDPAKKERVGAELAKRAQETLDERHRALYRAKGAGDEDFAPDAANRKYLYLFLQKWNAAKGNDWFVSSGWQKRTAGLFTVAGEMERAAAGP